MGANIERLSDYQIGCHLETVYYMYLFFSDFAIIFGRKVDVKCLAVKVVPFICGRFRFQISPSFAI